MTKLQFIYKLLECFTMYIFDILASWKCYFCSYVNVYYCKNFLDILVFL